MAIVTEAEYSHKPKTLDQLIQQVQNFDGEVVRVEPHFGEYDHQGEGESPQTIQTIVSVGIWILPYDEEQPIETEMCFNSVCGGWRLAGDGAGDPCVNGGSVLTGRDI